MFCSQCPVKTDSRKNWGTEKWRVWLPKLKLYIVTVTWEINFFWIVVSKRCDSDKPRVWQTNILKCPANGKGYLLHVLMCLCMCKRNSFCYYCWCSKSLEKTRLHSSMRNLFLLHYPFINYKMRKIGFYLS